MAENQDERPSGSALDNIDALWRSVLVYRELTRRLGFAEDDVQFVHNTDGQLVFLVARNGRTIALLAGKTDLDIEQSAVAYAAAHHAWVNASDAAREALWSGSKFAQAFPKFEAVVAEAFDRAAIEELTAPIFDETIADAPVNKAPQRVGNFIMNGQVYVPWRDGLVPAMHGIPDLIPFPILRVLVCHEILGLLGFGWWEVAVCSFEDKYVGIIVTRGQELTMRMDGDAGVPLEVVIDGQPIVGDALDVLIAESARIYAASPASFRHRVWHELKGEVTRGILIQALSRAGIQWEKPAPVSDLN